MKYDFLKAVSYSSSGNKKMTMGHRSFAKRCGLLCVYLARVWSLSYVCCMWSGHVIMELRIGVFGQPEGSVRGHGLNGRNDLGTWGWKRDKRNCFIGMGGCLNFRKLPSYVDSFISDGRGG